MTGKATQSKVLAATVESQRRGSADPSSPDAEITFSRLFRDLGPRVFRWAARLGGPGIDADDVVQEVFLVAHRTYGKYRHEGEISSWLFGITRNVVRMQARRERVRRLFAGRHARDALPTAAGPTPVEAILREDAARVVYQALQGLNEKQRTAFVLFEIEGLSGQEVAQLMNLNAATLRVQLFRGRKKFQERLRAMGIGEELP